MVADVRRPDTRNRGWGSPELTSSCSLPPAAAIIAAARRNAWTESFSVSFLVTFSS
jgi:hypothetical protein